MDEEIKNVQLIFYCRENWHAMSDVASGKHCDKCQKKVYDFTYSKANEFRKILAENGKRVCGRFNIQQMASIPIILPVWKRWLSAACVLVGINLFGCTAGGNQTLVGDTVMLPPTNLTQPEINQQQDPDNQRTVRPDEPVCTISRSKLIKGDVNILVDELPKFPGGVEKFYRFIKANLKYPAGANEVVSRVIITFVVNRDGSLTDIEDAGRRQNPLFEKEALRVMRKSPKWTPGKINGKPVKTQYTVPILFR